MPNSGGLRFRRQYPVGNLVVDFYSPATRIAIEIDGDSHAEQRDRDFRRTRWMEQRLGCQLLRFTNREVLYNTEAVLAAILRRARSCIPPPRWGRGGIHGAGQIEGLDETAQGGTVARSETTWGGSALP